MTTQLCAVLYSNVAPAIRHQRDAARRASSNGKFRYHRECGRGISLGISLSLSANQPLDSLIFESPEVNLICQGDLLTQASLAPRDRAAGIAHFLAREYSREGDAFVRHLRGTFAVIVYDHRLRLLKAWTDHFGEERLVFTQGDGFTAVATDLRLLQSLLPEQADIDPVAIQEYLQYSCVPAPRTIFKGISRLPGGHQLTCGPTPTVHPYWEMRYSETQSRQSEAEWAATTQQHIRSAVALNQSGVNFLKLGCFLSGGTDSSSIAGILSQRAGIRANTFSIGFDHPGYNEIKYARIAARHNKTNHREYFVTPDDILDLIEQAVPAYDEPFGNSSIIPTYYCAKLAAENGVTHLLAGDGGDELFGGNSRYAEDRRFQYYSYIPAPIRNGVVEPVLAASKACNNISFFDRASRYVRRANIAVPDRWFSYSFLSSVPASQLFTTDFTASLQGHDPLATARSHYHAATAQSDLNRWLYMDLKMTITDNDLRKVTTMSKLAGVTPRYPLLSPDLADFTGTIPPHLKVRGSQLRYIFKKAMANVLPAEIIAKQKHGFGLPYSVWLRTHAGLRELTLDTLGSTRFQQRGYFRKGLVEWLWSQYKDVHQQFYGDVLWLFLMLELWQVNQHDARARADVEIRMMARAV